MISLSGSLEILHDNIDMALPTLTQNAASSNFNEERLGAAVKSVNLQISKQLVFNEARLESIDVSLNMKRNKALNRTSKKNELVASLTNRSSPGLCKIA